MTAKRKKNQTKPKCPSGKVSFPSELDAKIALSRAQGASDRGDYRRTERRTYRCPLCHKYHMTSSK